MQNQSWQDQYFDYTYDVFIQEDQFNKIIQNLSKCNVDVVGVDLGFKTQHNLHAFQAIYKEQISQQSFVYHEEQQNKNQNKFRNSKIDCDKIYDVKQLSFPSYQFLNIFMKIYESRLMQMEIQFHYRFKTHRNYFKVYYPKNEKINSFFKNQIFQMKNKLYLHYSSDQRVVQKVKYSKYFNQLLLKQSIAAEHHYRTNQGQVAIFYSKQFNKKQIIEKIKKSLLQHMTIISIYDRKIKNQINKIIFKLTASFLSETINRLEKQNQIKIENAWQKCCFLVHDRHECFTDAKEQILKTLGNFMCFRLDGPNMRTLYNKIIRNHSLYPYLRAKYSKRNLYCVFDYKTFECNKKNVFSFQQLFQSYFQELQAKSKITFYIKYFNYLNLIPYVQSLIQKKSVVIQNYEYLITNQALGCSKLILSGKDFNQFTISNTKKQFYEVFLSIIQKKAVKQSNLQFKSINKETIEKYNFKENLITSEIQKQTKCKQQHFDQQKSIKTETQVSSVSESTEEITQHQPLVKKNSQYQRLRQKKPKDIQLGYEFKQPIYQPNLPIFWDLQMRHKKIQRALQQKYKDIFSKRGYKIFRLILRKKAQITKQLQIEEGKIYISMTIQKNNEIYHHFIDLNEFKKAFIELKDKNFFIFYKLKGQESYLPSFVIKQL